MKKWWLFGGSILGCLIAAPIVFVIVVVLLNVIGSIFGMSYVTTNVAIYYIVIPLIWFVMLVLFAYRAKKVLYWIMAGIAGIYLSHSFYYIFSNFLIGNELYFQKVFDISVYFLNGLPGDYILASVYACVVVPVIFTLGLHYLIKNKKSILLHKYLIFVFILFVIGSICVISAFSMFD